MNCARHQHGLETRRGGSLGIPQPMLTALAVRMEEPKARIVIDSGHMDPVTENLLKAQMGCRYSLEDLMHETYKMVEDIRKQLKEVRQMIDDLNKNDIVKNYEVF